VWHEPRETGSIDFRCGTATTSQATAELGKRVYHIERHLGVVICYHTESEPCLHSTPGGKDRDEPQTH